MGSNQVKTAPSPMLPVESCALSCQDNQERQIKKGIPRRLGSMILTHWIHMKRRERDIVEKARQAVKDGRAPPEVLEKIEKQVAKDSKLRHIKYHPKILSRKSKPARTRLKAPRLTNTAARRIQASFQRREKEQQTRQTRKQARSQISVKSQGWTDSTPSDSSRGTQTISVRRKRASSVPPPSSTLSLQSITTAESSGIGMSRTSSMTSVASSRHKTLYTRQRVRSLEDDTKLLEDLKELRERHGKDKTSRRVSSSTPSIPHLGETSGRHRCKTFERHMQQREELLAKQQAKRKPRVRQVSGDVTNSKQRTSARQPGRKSVSRDPTQHLQGDDRSPASKIKKSQPAQGIEKHPSRKSVDEEPSSDEVVYSHLSSYPRESEQESPNPQVSREHSALRRQRHQKNKKDQGSQTRVSGPPRPRRLLPTQQLRNRARVGQGEEQPSHTQQTEQFVHTDRQTSDGDSSPQEKTRVVAREKQVAVPVQSETHTRQQLEPRSKSTSSRERRLDLQLPLDNPRKVSADKRRKSVTDLDEQGRQHEERLQQEWRWSSQDQPQEVRGEKRIHVSRHQVQLHQAALGEQSRPQSHHHNEPQRPHQQERSQQHQQGDEQTRREIKLTKQDHEVLEPKRSESQGRAQTGQTRWQAAVKQVQESKRSVESRGGGRLAKLLGRRRSSKSSENLRTVEPQSESRPETSLERSPSVEAQGERRPEGSLEQGRIVESRGGGRLGRLLGRGRAVEAQDERPSKRTMERRRSSSSIESGLTRATLEGRLPGTSVEGGRRRRSIDLGSPERGHRSQLVEPILSDAASERVRNEGLTEQEYRERVHLERSRERQGRRPSIERVRHDPLVESFRSDPYLQAPRRDPSTGYAHREQIVEYTRQDPSTERVRREIRVLQEPVAEAGRSSSPTYHRGRTLSYGEGRRRNSLIQLDRGYNSDASESGYVRSYERRYNGGYPESTHTGASTARSVEPNYTRSYRRYAEPEYTRTYSERGYAGRSVDQDYTRTYPERIVSLNESRWRSMDEWEGGGRGRYREMVVPLSTAAAATPPTDHRSL